MDTKQIVLNKVQALLKVYPEAKHSNTELYIAFLETELQCELPHRIKMLMRKYKPETVTRMRRRISPSTNEQRQEEKKFRDFFGNKKSFN